MSDEKRVSFGTIRAVTFQRVVTRVFYFLALGSPVFDVLFFGGGEACSGSALEADSMAFHLDFRDGACIADGRVGSRSGAMSLVRRDG